MTLLDLNDSTPPPDGEVDIEQLDITTEPLHLSMPHTEQLNIPMLHIEPTVSSVTPRACSGTVSATNTSSGTPTDDIRRTKRGLLFEFSTQVTPKKSKTSSSQFTPPVPKATQITLKVRKSRKMNTELGLDRQYQTELSSGLFVLKRNMHSQTVTTDKHDKGIQVSIPKIHLLKTSDKELKKYTGIEDYKLFQILHKYLLSFCSEDDCIIKHSDNPEKVFSHIDTESQLLLVLYKLKRCPIDYVLSSEFGISTGRISGMFKYWIRRMFRKFKIINIWPSKEQVNKNMPTSTKSHFPDLVAISDCVEFSTQVPGGSIASKQMFSHYKNCHTTKIMYTTGPNGALIHCSDMYGGNASDKEIFEQNNLAERLQPGDGIMVDKGFMIRDCIQSKGIKLYRPPFLSEKKTQFDPDERDSERLIARSRITVENFNARISTYAFLKQRKIPVLYLPMMNEIGFVCGFLANLGPLIRRYETVQE